MNNFLLFSDKVSTWVGKAFAWSILVMTFGMTYEVFVRYLLRAPTSWAFDLSYIMYGVLFMMGGAYTLSRNGHVRGDVVYRLWPPRVQAAIELVLYIIFFFPGITALVYAGTDYALESWSYMEVSVWSPANVPVFQFKTVIPIAGALLFLQGVAQVIRCIICIRSGEWPTGLHDVEELETVLLHEYQEKGLVEMSDTPQPARDDKDSTR
jgi:TRAP-type mannitol/chloroaromatic compound transport system permease small subunit